MIGTTRLLLVRHGESVAQAEQIVGGHDGCRGLTERGRRQAAALRERWAETGELGDVVSLYSSVMPRAVETAAIVAPAVPGLAPAADCDFCEHHPGAMDGMAWSDADEQHPPPARWDPDGRRAPGSETWNEMAERVARALDGLQRRHGGQTVVVVCHGGVIVHSMIRWLGLDPTAAGGRRATIEPANCSITEWRLVPHSDGDGRERVELARFNDHAHLVRDVAR